MRARLRGLLICLLLGTMAASVARARPSRTQLETELLSRVFVPITDSAAGNYRIDGFRMSADASRAVFLVTLLSQDPRGCTTRQQLRLVDVWTRQESVIYTGFTYDTTVGNPCRSSLDLEAFDISDDGSRVVYARRENLAPDLPLPELVFYDVTLNTSQVILQELPYSSFGTPSTRRIDPKAGSPAPFALSGDGAWLWLINQIGPWGSPGASGDPGPSGLTLYRVSVPGGGATPELEDRELPFGSLPAGAAGLLWNTRFPVSTDGSVALVKAGNGGSAPFEPSLVAVEAGSGPVEIYSNPAKGLIGTQAMSGDARRVVFGNRGDTATAQPERLLVLDLDENLVPGDPRVLDPDLTVSNPQVSSDGSFVAYWEGTREAIRWAHTEPGVFMREINKPAVHAWSSHAEISADGVVHLIHGSAKSDGLAIQDLEPNLLVSFWSDSGDLLPLGAPFTDVPYAHWAAGDPTLCFHRDPFLFPVAIHTYQYLTTGAVSTAFSWGFDMSGRNVVRNGMAGLNDFGDLADDGETERDTAAGDGVYSDTSLWLSDSLYPDDPVVYIRLALANEQGLASHHDLAVRVFEPHEANRREWITTSNKLEWTFADTGVTLVLTEPAFENGFLAAQYFPGMPPAPAPPLASELPDVAAGYWRILHGPDIQTSPVLDTPFAFGRLEFQYSLANLAAADLETDEIGLFFSLDCGLSWIEVESDVDLIKGVIRTHDPRSTWKGHWAIARIGSRGPTVFKDTFELGNLAGWSRVVD